MPKGKKTAAVSNANTDRAALIAKAASRIKPEATNALANSALTSSLSRFELGNKLLAFIGKTAPDSVDYAARYNAGRRSLLVGYLAARVRRDGDNRPDDVLLTYGAEILDCAKADAGSLKDGQRRRTEAEERAYGAGRVWLSGIVGECGIKPPVANGGGNNGADKTAERKAKALKEAKANPQAAIAAIKSEVAQTAIKQLVANARKADKEALKLAPPAANDAEAFVDYAERMVVMLLQRLDKVAAATGGAVPPQIGSALTDCKAAIAAARKSK